MIRILHFADLHLGVENYGHIDPQTGLSSRLGDFLAAFDQLVDFAFQERVDLVLFCGDAYRSRDPSQTHQREFARRVARLVTADIRVFLLAGNHDLPNMLARASAVEIFDTLAVPGVTVAVRPCLQTVPTRSGPVQVAALPWLVRSSLLAKEGLRAYTAEQLNVYIEDMIARDFMADFTAQLDPTLPAVLAAHLGHSGAVPGSEHSMLVGRDYVVPQSVLDNHAFDYVALGHIHSHQEATGSLVPMVYPGSLERIDFGEEGQEKGFYLVELDASRPRGERCARHAFVPVDARPFVTVKLDALSGDPTAQALAAIGRASVTGAVVRFSIKLSTQNEAFFREAEVRRALDEAHYLAAFVREVDRPRRERLAGASIEQLTPEQALGLYLEKRRLPEEQSRLVREYGERLIAEATAAAE